MTTENQNNSNNQPGQKGAVPTPTTKDITQEALALAEQLDKLLRDADALHPSVIAHAYTERIQLAVKSIRRRAAVGDFQNVQSEGSL